MVRAAISREPLLSGGSDMIDQNRKDTLRSNISPAVIVTAMLLAVVAGTASEKSLYVIKSIWNSDGDTPIQVYNIGADGALTLQAEYRVPMYGEGAVGLAADPDGKYLFLTYEGSNTIQVVDATTADTACDIQAPGAVNLAGIVCGNSGLLYCVERYTEKLYVYKWEPKTAKLTLVPGSPFILIGSTAYGIALDEIHGLLYVANGTNKITVYRTTDWSLARTILLNREVISVALDVKNSLLYAGGGYFYDNFFLTQYSLATGTQKEVQVEPDACVMGLAVDFGTSLVYMSTGRNNQDGGDRLLVYNDSLQRVDSTFRIGGDPTGLVIPFSNPLNLVKDVTGVVTGSDGVITKYAKIGETFTYIISFDARTYQPNSVSIVDTLPAEVTFVGASGDQLFGHYNETMHNYTWSNPPQETDGPTRLELEARVKNDVPEGTIITNWVVISSDRTMPTTISKVVVAANLAQLNPLNLTKKIIGRATDPNTDGTEYVNAGDIFAYALYLDNTANNQAVHNVSLIDTLPQDVIFVSAERDGLVSQYDSGTHTYTWYYDSLAAGAHACQRLLVKVRETTAQWRIVTNSAAISSDETPESSTSFAAVVKKLALNPLNLTKSVIGGTVDPNDAGQIQVNAGDTIAYAICFDNTNNDQPVNDVSIVDLLPSDVSFITADGDNVFGQYDDVTHSYVWNYTSVPAGSSACVRLIGRVAQDVAIQKTMVNLAIIDSNTVKSTTASIGAIVEEVVYNPLKITKSIVGAITDPNTGVAYVNAGDTLIYSIYFDNSDNASAVNDVSVLDILPFEMTFVAAGGAGVSAEYDALTHTCKWTYPSLPAGASAYVTLVAQVDSNAVPGTRIRNYAIVDRTDVQSGTATFDVIVRDAVHSPLDLTKSVAEPAIPAGSSSAVTYVHPGDTVTYNVCFDNNGNDVNVDDVTIVDKLADQVTFVQADGDGVFGNYDPNTHTYVWAYQSVPAGSSACLKLTVRVKEGIANGTKITNFAIVDSSETRSTLASVDVTTYYNPLKISKTVTLESSNAGGCVAFGQTLTYTICFDNNDNDQAISNVKIVDSLPQWVAFESADGNGVFGHYDLATHTYTWSYASIAPKSSSCVHIVCRVKENAPEKTKLTNSVVISGEGVIVKTAGADVVTCEKPVKAELFLLPLWISPYSGLDQITAIVRFPKGIKKSDIELTPLELYPSGEKSVRPVRTYVIANRVRIYTRFEKRDLVAITGTNGLKVVRVTGVFKSGRSFYADGLISVAP
jgi:uncharacterized repeat protein (TIGR01451 family)